MQLNSFVTRCFNLICALAFIGVVSVPAAAATKINFRILAEGDQPSGQMLFFQATEKDKLLFPSDPSDHNRGFAWFYDNTREFQQSFDVKDPLDLNMSFLRIETAIGKTKLAVVECHGYEWLNTALRAFLANNPTVTELNIDLTLSTTFIPNPDDDPRNGLSPGIGGMGPDPDKIYQQPEFIEASACNVTYKINGMSFPTH